MCYDISFKVEIKQLTDYFPELIISMSTEKLRDGKIKYHTELV